MANETRVVSLRCTNCGATLKIPAGVDTLACGYCGTQQLVERGGGIVALKPVIEAIQKVQEGAEKAAAELALVRLEKEASALEQDQERELSAIGAKCAAASGAEREKGTMHATAAMVIGAIAGVVLWIKYGHFLLLMSVSLACAGALAGWLWSAHQGKARRIENGSLAQKDGACIEFASRRKPIQDEIRKNRTIIQR